MNEFAPGIPFSRVQHTIPTVQNKDSVTWDFVEHYHEAKKAGPHSDVRLSDGTNAYSWAVRKGLPDIGAKHLAIRQPDHTPDYMTYKGVIEDGYGKGTVSIKRLGKAKIITAGPDKIHFVLLDRRNPETYVLINTGEDWLLMNNTPTTESHPEVPQFKPVYKTEPTEKLKNYLDRRYLMTAKLDGGHMIYDFTKSHPQIFSYRPSKSGDALINHTYLARLDELQTPAALRGSVFRGEIFATKDGKALDARVTSGLLNSAPEKGMAKIKEDNIKLRHALFDVVRKGRTDWERQPYEEKWKVLNEAVKVLPRNFMLPEYAIAPDSKKELFKRIETGKYPLSTEGVVLWDKKAPNTPVKIKFREHDQVFIRKIFEGMGKKSDMAGGYEYSLTKDGPIVGRVGTGFDETTAKDMWHRRKEYEGRSAVINHRGQMPSGAYYQPSHSYFHM